MFGDGPSDWNFQHLVRRSTQLLVNYVNASRGLPPLEILAPPAQVRQELGGDELLVELHWVQVLEALQ